MSILKAKLTQQIMANMISVTAPLAMDMMDCKICHYDQGPEDPANFDPKSRLAIISFWHEYIPVSYTHLPSPRDRTRSRMPSSA